MKLVEVKNNEITLVDQAVEQFSKLIQAKIQFDTMEAQFKEELKKAMEDHGIKSFDHPLLKATYVAPTERRSLDSKKIKELYPLIAEECEKVSSVKSSIRLQLK